MKWILIILIGLLPIAFYALPDIVGFASNDIGMFYHYGVNETNYHEERDIIHDRLNFLPDFDQLSLYAPRIKESSEGKFVSDAYVKDYAGVWVLDQDVLGLYFYGTVSRLIGISWTYLLNIFVAGLGVFLLLFWLTREYVKNDIMAALIAAIPLFSFRFLSMVFKEISTGHVGSILGVYDFVPNGQVVRIISLSFPLIIFLGSLVVIPRLIEGWDHWWKQTLMFLLVGVNAYVYFYSWTLLGVILGFVVLYYLMRGDKKWKRATGILAVLTFFALPQIYTLLLQRMSHEDMSFYGLYTANIGDLLNLFWLCALLLFLYYFARKMNMKMTTTSVVVFSSLIASAVLSNVDLVLEFPQPDHYLHFFRLLFVISALVVLYHLVQKKWLFWGAYGLVLIPIVIFSLLTISLEQPATAPVIQEADLALFYYLNMEAKDSTVTTLSIYMNTLIPIHTRSYVFLPNILYSGADINESVSRYVVLTDNIGMSRSEAYEYLLSHHALYNILLHRLEDRSLVQKIIEKKEGSYFTEYVLITPLERELGWKPQGELVFSNAIYELYFVNSTLQTTGR